MTNKEYAIILMWLHFWYHLLNFFLLLFVINIFRLGMHGGRFNFIGVLYYEFYMEEMNVEIHKNKMTMVSSQFLTFKFLYNV